MNKNDHLSQNYTSQSFFESCVQEWQLFISHLQKKPDLASFLQDGDNTSEQKNNMIKEIFSGLISPFTMHTLNLLVEQNKLFVDNQINSAGIQLFNQHHRILPVTIITPYPLNQKQEIKLINVLREKCGQEILLEKEIDPQLIGGSIIKIGDKIYDDSIKTKLATLTAELLKK